MTNGSKKYVRSSVRSRLTKYISIGIVSISLTAILVVGREIVSVTSGLMQEHIVNVSENESKQAVTELTNAVSSVTSFASILSGWNVLPADDRETYISSFVKQQVSGSAAVLSAWTVWFPGTITGVNSGTTSVNWYRTDKGIAREQFPLQDASWIRYAADNTRPHLLEPHLSTANGRRDYIVSAVAPVYGKDGTSVCGIAGIDLSLTQINTYLSSLRVYKSGYGVLSAAGCDSRSQGSENAGAVVFLVHRIPRLFPERENFKTLCRVYDRTPAAETAPRCNAGVR